MNSTTSVGLQLSSLSFRIAGADMAVSSILGLFYEWMNVSPRMIMMIRAGDTLFTARLFMSITNYTITMMSRAGQYLLGQLFTTPAILTTTRDIFSRYLPLSSIYNISIFFLVLFVVPKVHSGCYLSKCWVCLIGELE